MVSASMKVVHSVESLDERDADRRATASISGEKRILERNFFPCALWGCGGPVTWGLAAVSYALVRMK